MLVFVISILTTRGWSSAVAHVQNRTKARLSMGPQTKTFFSTQFHTWGRKKCSPWKKKKYQIPVYHMGFIFFLSLKKTNYILFTCFTREKLLLFLFFIFFSVSEMAKKLRNLNRLAWQKCLFHQFSSHKHKRENILDQIIKKKSFTCSSGLPQNTDYDCCHFCLFGSHCSYIVSILCYHFI